MNFKEVIDTIEEECGFKADEVPRPVTFVWLPSKSAIEVSIRITTISKELTPEAQQVQIAQWVAEMDPPLFTVGSECPLRRAYTIAAIFHDDEEVRVYCVDKRGASERLNGSDSLGPACYRLSKKAPTFVVERMTLDVLIQEVVREWQGIKAAGEDPLDEERLDVLERISDAVTESGFGDTEPFSTLLKELHATEEPDEEEEEEKEAAKGVAAPPAHKELPPPPPPAPPATARPV